MIPGTRAHWPGIAISSVEPKLGTDTLHGLVELAQRRPIATFCRHLSEETSKASRPKGRENPAEPLRGPAQSTSDGPSLSKSSA